MKRFFLFSGLISVLLLAGCSQEVSSADDEELSEDVVEESSSSSSKKSSSSAKSLSSGEINSSSSVKSSNSAESSSSADSLSAGKSSNSVESSSSAESSSSSNTVESSSETMSSSVAESSSALAESSSSSKKVQPKQDDYPYYDYVAVPWSIGPRKSTPRYYDAAVFDSLKYTLIDTNDFRNDFTWNDQVHMELNSVDELARSVLFSFYQTGAKRYLVSFEEPDPKYSLPVLRVVDDENSSNYIVRGVKKNGRVYYPIDYDSLNVRISKERKMTVIFYYSTLRLYDQRWPNFTISDDGTGYPQSFNINLIVAGKYMGTSDSVSVDLLSKRILDRLNLGLNPGGITVGEVKVLYAKDHPVVGSDFPESESIVHFRSRDDRHASIESLSMWPGHEGEISFILGHYVKDGADSRIGGFSPMPGRIYYKTLHMDCSPKSYIKDDNPECPTQIYLATHVEEGERNLSSREISSAALHEVGHFFGLMHTTENGVIVFGGKAADDLDDTPECHTNFFPVQSMAQECDDYGYLMFPGLYPNYEYTTFTPQQMEIIRTYLASNPH